MTLIAENYDNREDWLEARKDSIGSSLTPLLLGLGPKSNERNGWLHWWMRLNPAARQRYADQLQEEETRLQTGSGINFKVRTAMEPFIEEMMVDELGAVIYDPGQFFILRSGEKPWLTASPDGLVLKPGHFDLLPGAAAVEEAIETGVIVGHSEMKSIRWNVAYKWRDGEPDLQATVQLHHLLAMPDAPVSSWPGGLIGGMIGYGDSKDERLAFEVERDDDLIELIQETCERFWGYIERDEEPPMDGYLSTTRALRLMHPGRRENKVSVTLGNQFIASHLGWQNTNTEIKKLKRELERHKQEIEAVAAENDAGEVFIPADPDSLPAGAKWSRTLISPKDATCKHCGEVIRKARPYTKFTSTKR